MAISRPERLRIGGLLLGLTAAIVIAVIGYHQFHSIGEPAPAAASAPIEVQTVLAKVSALKEQIGASGTIQPSMPLEMTSKVVARVTKVPVDLGAIVRPGDLLVQLDAQLYEA